MSANVVKSAPANPPLDDENVLSPALHHVNLGTTRLDEMIDWYGKVVGMRVLHRASKPGLEAVWMTNDAANHRLAMSQRPHLEEDENRIAHPGLRHTAYEFEAIGELLGTYVRLKREGITPDFCLDHGMTISFYYADPDGNRVELQADCFGDWERSSRFIDSDPRFEADPIGPQVDPDAMAAAYREGASREELHERGYAGEFSVERELDLR
jgi:catechol-2,3-dioxygenase